MGETSSGTTPPYNSAVKQNIGKIFLQLLDKHFPPRNKFRTIFNHNCVKLSYSCMPNMKSIISGHNKQILQKSRAEADNAPIKLCNCQKKAQCPLNGACLTKSVIYQVTVTLKDEPDEAKVYTGLTDNTFKEIFSGHKYSFTHTAQRDSTTLSQHVWQLKDRGMEMGRDFDIKWKILKKCKSYSCGTRSCDLCTTEKYFILLAHPDKSLNKRSELISKCRHRRKYKLERIT